MRVLQALTSGGVGGAERMVASLAERLPMAGIDVEVSVLDGGGPVLDALAAAGVATHRLGGDRSYIEAVRRMRALFRSRRFDAVHFYGFRMGLVARAAITPGRPPLIHGIQGMHLGDWDDADSLKTRVAVAIERVGGGAIARYLCVSASGRAFLTDRGLPASKFEVIPNAVDVGYWCPAAEPSPERMRMLAVANLRPVKRLDLLIEAMAELKSARGPDFEMVLVGEGGLRHDLERQVHGLGLDDVVTFAGSVPRDRVRSLQRQARLSVLTSSSEGSPVSLLEAMACGRPVIGTDVPGIRDVIEHERTGLLAASDPRGIAAACARLLDDSEFATRLGRIAREVVVERYSLERIVQAYAAMYRTVGARR